MARQLLGTAPKPSEATWLGTPAAAGPRQQLSPQAVEARLRRERSRAYVEAMTALDAGGHCCNRAAVDELLRRIGAELPELSVDHHPIGILAECHLGSPFEVHTLDRVGAIITHYRRGESMSPPFERGRSLALHPSYAFVEIYPDKVIPVAATGYVSIAGGRF